MQHPLAQSSHLFLNATGLIKQAVCILNANTGPFPMNIRQLQFVPGLSIECGCVTV